MPTFHDFPLQPATHAVLKTMQISEPTPIQAEAIPALLAGRDLVGRSATGSGKTLAYGLPLVERLSRERVAQALILVPTRELAMQVNTVLTRFASSKRLTTALLVGGRAYGAQISSLRYGSQIIVGTPGRVQDHLDRGTLSLSQLRICVLDEADQMLDSGFAPAIEEILTNTPETRQTALFSATMPDWVVKLQQKFLKDPVHVTITPDEGAQSTIEQIAYQVPQSQKMAALCTLLQATPGESSLIFGKTKFGVEKLGKQLSKLGFTVGTLHGNKSQSAREKVLSDFRRGQVQTLLATNVAARGLDIKGIHQVINYELPESSELFTHRIGRTGRMGQQGKAITLLAPSDVGKWRRMTRGLGPAVTLQRLEIPEDALTTMASAQPEGQITAEPEQYSEPQQRRDSRKRFSQEPAQYAEPQQGRGRRRFSQEPGQYSAPRQDRGEHKRFSRDEEHEQDWSQQEDLRASGSKARGQRRLSSVMPAYEPAWEPEGYPLPARPNHGRNRDGERGAGRPSNGGRPAARRTPAFGENRPQRPTNRRGPGAAPATRNRQATPSYRSAGR